MLELHRKRQLFQFAPLTMDYIYNLSQKISKTKVFVGIETVVSTLLGLTLVFPILGLLLGLNEVLRLIFGLYLWLAYDDKIKLSDDECGSNYQNSPAIGRHTILYLGEIDGVQDVDSLRRNYQKHVIENKTYSKLTYTLEQGWLYPCLRKCDAFHINNHIRYYPGTEQRTVTEKELLEDILPELGRDMAYGDKPQWEEVIIPYYQKQSVEQIIKNDEDDQSLLASQATISLRIIRIHHSYMDGASTLLMIANAMSGESDEFPYVIDPCKPLKVSKLSMFLYKLTCLALFSITTLRNLMMPPFTRSSRFTVPPDSVAKVLYGWTNKLPIDVFNKIKGKTGVSMPAIITSVLASAIRKLELKYPHTKGKVVDDSPPTVPNTHPIWVVAAMFPIKSTKPDNQHTVIEAHANTSDISRVERLSIMNDDLGRLAKNPMITINYWFHRILGRIPCLIEDIFMYMVSCPVVLSNVPLTTRNIRLFGRECYSIVGWVPLIARTGMGVVTVRFANHFRYCVQVDSSAVNQEQLDYFISQIEEEVKELFLETAQLQRKISTEPSLYYHDNKDTQQRKRCKHGSMQQDENVIAKPKDNTSLLSSCINNNNLSIEQSVDEAIKIANHPFIFKLKDSIKQIREGIRKVKEH